MVHVRQPLPQVSQEQSQPHQQEAIQGITRRRPRTRLVQLPITRLNAEATTVGFPHVGGLPPHLPRREEQLLCGSLLRRNRSRRS